ncbi:uncharacterized protein J8A68_004378 [[Candida] subhashii]|uniref:RRM domain-containing protein n=1 Tax=[Candida] subhashii TaxID=561895 RepID=A0A8J5UKL5_9ASCO|nr:uncharacterized protein J8A68_004378 [[Candida] subhashii]KAG7662116.1 hypothetical protein J8A68_004378 [[Candida] subhashii]
MEIAFPDRPPLPSAVKCKTVDLKEIDDRISLDQESDTWIFEHQDQEYQYDYNQDKWIQKSRKHKRTEEDEDDEDEKLNKQDIKKHKKEQMSILKQRLAKLKQEHKQGSTQPSKEGEETKNKNHAVFISNLPLDSTEEQIIEQFSKYGLISEDFKTGKPRVKLYYQDDGKFKGEALVIYHNPESVTMAIEMADGTHFGTELNEKISVQPASFKNNDKKKEADDAEIKNKRKEINKARQKTNKKLTSWESDEEQEGEVVRYENTLNNIKQKILLKKLIVSLKGMFRKQEYQTDKYLQSDITEDIKDECSKLNIEQDIKTIEFNPDNEEINLFIIDILMAYKYQHH